MPASTPTPGRQLLQTGPDGRADLVRVSAESKLAAEGPRPGGARPAPERSATGPDTSFSYIELRADGTMGPTTLRPGENVLHSKPLSDKPQEQLLSYSADGRSWDVNSVTPAVRTAGAAQPRPTQMLRQNPDGTVDLLTFHKPLAPASGPPAKPRPNEASFHELDGPGVRRGWQSRSFSPDEGFRVEQVSRPQSTGHRRDGKELFFQREPTSLLVRDHVSHQWRPLGTTEGVATLPKGWGRAPDAPPVTVGKPAGNPSGQGTPPDAHYRWNTENGTTEPVKVPTTSVEVAEIGAQTRSVSIDRHTATGGANGLDSLRMLPDGTLVPANPRTITDQIRVDPESGAITMDGAGPTGGHSFGGGGAPGSGGGGAPGSRGSGPSHGSATQRPGEVNTAATGHSDRSAATHVDSRLQDASAPPGPARADAGSTRIEDGAVPVRPDPAATRADVPGPVTPRASAPTPGRQLLQTGPDGRAELVRVSAASRFPAEGPRPGGARPAPERSATGPDTSFSYIELRADGTMGPTTLRPGENVLHSKPLSGKPQKQILSYSAEGRSWDVDSVGWARQDRAAQPQPRPTQMLRQNPDGTVDLLTFHKPPAPASGPPVKPRPGEPSFHELDGPGVRHGWQSRSFSPDEGFTAKPVSKPSAGRRVDGEELFFQREPTSLLVRDQMSHRWTPLGTTEGVAPGTLPVTGGKSAGNPSFSRGGTGGGTPSDSAHYHWSIENGRVEPVKVPTTSLEVVEIGTQSRSVSIDRYMATGGTGGGNGLDSMRMLPDGTFVPANPRTITSEQIRLDPESGAITMDGAGPTGGHSFGGGGAPGSGGGGAPGSRGAGPSSRGPSHGSATQTDNGALTFVKPRSTTESSAAAMARDGRTHSGAVDERPDPGHTLDSKKPATRAGAGIGGPEEAKAARIIRRENGKVVLGAPAEAPRNVLRKPQPEQTPGTEVRAPDPTPGGHPAGTTPGAPATTVAPAHDAAPATPVDAVTTPQVAAKPQAPPAVADPTPPPAPTVPMRPPLAHEAPYVTAMPDGLSLTGQGNVVHLHTGTEPTRLVLRPGPNLTVVVDGSVTSLPTIRAALTKLHPSQPPLSTVEFVGARQPITPERAQQIADRLLTGLPGHPQINLLASALTDTPTGAPTAKSYRFAASTNHTPGHGLRLHTDVGPVEAQAGQQRAVDDTLAELRDPYTEIVTLDQAARTQQWKARQDALRADYAARIGTARRVEQFRPDLVGAFGNAVAEAAARSERSSQPESLDRLPAEVTDRFRTEFVAAGRHLFDQVWAPVIAAGIRGDDPAFQVAEHEWQVRYEQLLTAVRGIVFSDLQAHRHEAAVQAAVIEARGADRDVPESAVAEGDDTTPLLEAKPTAYESAARPVVDQARADIHAALHRPGRDIDAVTRQRITHLVDGSIREATTDAQTWAERGGHTPAVVAAAVDGLRDRLSDLVRSIPVLLLHHALLGEQVRAAGSAFDELPTIDLPAPVSEALSRSFTLDWLTAYDELFRGDAVATTELQDFPETVQLATAGMEPLGRVSGVPAEQIQALPISDSELTAPLPDARTAADDTLAAAGHAEIRDAFLTEVDPVRRNTLLAGLLGESDAVLSALPALHTGLPVVTTSDAAMARMLGYAHGAARGEPLPVIEVRAAARGLQIESKLALIDGLRLLAVANPARQSVLQTLGVLAMDC
ncbi:hypothetical protein [Micromonospora orduensis]|uniref:hypothetical protein n=1 Tax=Micromonospora orduensis TaxID=1420891 RepID=UPI003634BFC1